MGPLRILVVDDSEDDVLLIAHALEKENFTPVVERVDSAEKLSAALEQPWDVVLSDFSLPGFGGKQALELYQKTDLDIPFIIVSGRIGEETAVEMMRAGAHDYVMKDDLARLVPAIERELRAAGERRVRRQAEIAMAHLAAIVENCEDAIISQTIYGTILSWNAGAEATYGYSADEMIGRSISAVIPVEQRGKLSIIRELLERGERLDRIETIHQRKDGKNIDVSLTISPVRDDTGTVTGASIVARDISQRIRQEKERLRLIEELKGALARVKTLNGLLPICASCKKIRNDHGYWEQVEIYIKNHSQADFTHGICPDCIQRLYPEYAAIRAKRQGDASVTK